MTIPIAQTRELFASTIAEIDTLERNILNAEYINPDKLKALGVTHRQLIVQRNAWKTQLATQLRILETRQPFAKTPVLA